MSLLKPYGMKSQNQNCKRIFFIRNVCNKYIGIGYIMTNCIMKAPDYINF